MTKTEAAQIIVNFANVYARRHGWTGRMDSMRIGIVLSVMEHETEPGSLAQQAARIRPSDRYLRTVAHRAC